MLQPASLCRRAGSKNHGCVGLVQRGGKCSAGARGCPLSLLVQMPVAVLKVPGGCHARSCSLQQDEEPGGARGTEGSTEAEGRESLCKGSHADPLGRGQSLCLVCPGYKWFLGALKLMRSFWQRQQQPWLRGAGSWTSEIQLQVKETTSLLSC